MNHNDGRELLVAANLEPACADRLPVWLIRSSGLAKSGLHFAGDVRRKELSGISIGLHGDFASLCSTEIKGFSGCPACTSRHHPNSSIFQAIATFTEETEVEDRMNTGLLLVQFDLSAQDNLNAWDARLSALPGISRVSWWHNVFPHRQDWIGAWRRIRDFETLAVCELDGPVENVRCPDGVRSVLFRRAARPSQGILRLPTLGLCVVMISPIDATNNEDARTLRDWGDFVHFPGIVEAHIPGYALVTPYENVSGDAPRFLHFYEFCEADAETVFGMTRACVTQRFDSKPGTPAFDRWANHPLMAHDYLGNFTRMTLDTH